MINVIKAELFRFRKSKASIIVLIVTIIVSLLGVMQLYNQLLAMTDLNIHTEKVLGSVALDFTGIDGIITFISPFLAVFFFNSEFTKNTIKNIVTKKTDRPKVLFGKYIAMSISIFCIILSISLISTIVATFINGFGTNMILESIGQISYATMRITLFHIAYISIAIVPSLLFSNEAMVVILFYLFVIIQSLIKDILDSIIPNNKVLFAILPSSFGSDFQKIQFDGSAIYGYFTVVFWIAFGIIVSFCIMRKKHI